MDKQITGGEMIYQFKCQEHGVFEVEQLMLSQHRAKCQCGAEGQRIYSTLEWIWVGSAYRPDGSLREDKDYASVMTG